MGKEESKERARVKRLADYYNLTLEESDRIDAHQNHLCWVCGRPEHVKGRRLATDHSHLNGLIRGRLCSQCNPILGKLENAFVRLGMHKIPGINFVHIVEKIAAYVKNPPAVTALGREVFGYAGRVGTKKHRKLLKKLAKATIPSKPLLQVSKEAK